MYESAGQQGRNRVEVRLMRMKSIIMVLVQLAVVCDVVPEEFVHSVLEANGFHQQVVGSEVAFLDHFVDSSFIRTKVPLRMASMLK